MPELPEVETVRRGLYELIVGRTITAETHDTEKGFPNAPHDVAQFLIGASVTDVRRRAKVLLIDLSSGYSLVIHLKMTGQLVWVGVPHLLSPPVSAPLLSSRSQATARKSLVADPVGESAPENFSDELKTFSGAAPLAATRAGDTTVEPLANKSLETSAARASDDAYSTEARREAVSEDFVGEEGERNKGDNRSGAPERFGAGHPNDSLIGDLPDKSTRVTLAFTDGSHLYFNDQRKFGWVKLYPTAEVPNIDFMQKVGPEPLEDDFTPEIFYERLQRRKNTTIKAAILDQTVLAGVGNIYADEGLWGAKIHPATRVKDVSRPQIGELWREIREVMNLAIQKGGSSNHTYINAEGKKGSYMDFARAFRRDGQPCPRHPDVLIEKIKVAGRGTHICPVCQTEP